MDELVNMNRKLRCHLEITQMRVVTVVELFSQSNKIQNHWSEYNLTRYVAKKSA